MNNLHSRLEKLSHEDLVSELGVVSIQECLYPSKRTYLKKRLACEKELIHRLGGDWNEYCRINGWEAKELEDLMRK